MNKMRGKINTMKLKLSENESMYIFGKIGAIFVFGILYVAFIVCLLFGCLSLYGDIIEFYFGVEVLANGVILLFVLALSSIYYLGVKQMLEKIDELYEQDVKEKEEFSETFHISEEI